MSRLTLLTYCSCVVVRTISLIKSPEKEHVYLRFGIKIFEESEVPRIQLPPNILRVRNTYHVNVSRNRHVQAPTIPLVSYSCLFLLPRPLNYPSLYFCLRWSITSISLDIEIAVNQMQKGRIKTTLSPMNSSNKI